MIRRPPTLAREGMIATSHPLASEAGIAMLRAGGTAVDALIAAAAVLSVVEPSASGLGGDAFFLVHEGDTGRVRAYNGSGRAPRSLTRDRFAGHESVPLRTPLACTTPGCVEAWDRASREWGRLEWRELLAPAVHHATQGFPVSWRMGRVLGRMREVLAADSTLREIYLHDDGSPLKPGETCHNPALARSLTTLRDEGARSFYEGRLAEELAAGVAQGGGALAAQDLAEHEGRLSTPYTLKVDGYTIFEQPLPSQGLLLLNMLGSVAAARPAETGWRELHRQVESKKIAFALKEAFLTDPETLPVPESELASLLAGDEVANTLAGLFNEDVLRPELATDVVLGRLESHVPAITELIAAYEETGSAPRAGGPPRPAGLDTTYLCAADRDSTVAGLIQSIFHVFGSGYQEPRTGVLLNNRACGFSLDPTHVNRLEPGKRTLHTLNSYLVHRHGRPWMVGGTPGGDHQVQTNLQVLRHLFHGRSLWPGPEPQVEHKWTQARAKRETEPLPYAERLAEALEAPRWGVEASGRVRMESRFPAAVRHRLLREGHDVVRVGPWEGSGLVQAILVLEPEELAGEDRPASRISGYDMIYLGATDPRGEGVVLGL